METTTKFLRLHTKEVMAAVDRGEEIIITWRGHRRARLKAFDQPQNRKGQNPAFALWSDCRGSVDETVRQLRQPREFE